MRRNGTGGAEDRPSSRSRPDPDPSGLIFGRGSGALPGTILPMRYRDRVDAGRKLAVALREGGYDPDDLLILGVARGGLPVAAEVAAALDGELDVAVARKIGAPGNPEFAIGAIAAGGDPILSESTIRTYGIGSEYAAEAAQRAREEIARRTAAYRAGRPDPEYSGRTVIVVDDGVATGSTLTAVLRSVRDGGAAKVVCAVPVGPRQTLSGLRDEADDVVCPVQPHVFTAVGEWYEDFTQITDEQVAALLSA